MVADQRNAVERIAELGQSIWLDQLTRRMLRSGELRRLIATRGLRGLTCNPTIFAKALATGDYDDQIASLAARRLTALETLEALQVTDTRAACDELRAVFDRTGGVDGVVSIEVSPLLARDRDATGSKPSACGPRSTGRT